MINNKNINIKRHELLGKKTNKYIRFLSNEKQKPQYCSSDNQLILIYRSKLIKYHIIYEVKKDERCPEPDKILLLNILSNKN